MMKDKSENKTVLKPAVTSTLIASGAVYAITYLMISENFSKAFAAVSFLIGLLVYLGCYQLFKKREKPLPENNRTYRVIIWLVPLLAFIYQAVLLYENAASLAPFADFYTLSELRKDGLLAVLLWPFLNFLVIVHNLATLGWTAIYNFGLPALNLILAIMILSMLNIVRQLFRVKRSSVIPFSLLTTCLYALLPATGFVLLVNALG